MQTNNKEQTIILETYQDEASAEIAKDKLEDQGITSFIENETSLGMNPLGGITLRVLTHDQVRARDILKSDNS